MRIGELAKRGGVSVRAIRFYERRRLIRTSRRTPAGYRIYSEKDLETVTVIKKMQRFGFKLAEIRRVLRSADTRLALTEGLSPQMLSPRVLHNHS